ncbi:hypothetical protein ACSBR2_030962 [Camellia fascicularis]
MQDFIGSVRQSLVFKPFGGFVEKISSSIHKSVIRLFSKPSVPALPPIAKSEAIKVKKDDTPRIWWRKGELIGCANSAAKEKTQAHIRELDEEVNLLKNLSHPNIIRYLGTTREEESLNILLEIVPSGSISSLLGKFGSFPESVIRMYTKQLLLGLEYLHKNGIMQKDIKGANILVDNKGCIKLADFGASKKVVELAIMTGAKSMKGTPYWMASEVILQTGHSLKASLEPAVSGGILKPSSSIAFLLKYLFVLLTNNLGLSKISMYLMPIIFVYLMPIIFVSCFSCPLEPNLRPTASDLLQHPFVTGECQETHPEKFPGSNCDDDMFQIDDEDDLVIGATAKFDSALFFDDFNKSFNPMSEPNDNWLCKSDNTPEKLPGSVPHWGSCNCDDDMCQIDNENDLVIGASAKFVSALLSDDFNKSFNPMSEPDDNWPCKSDDTPELESKVNLFSGQTVNKAADIPRASGKGNDDFTFPCGPLVAEEDDDDDEVIESKIIAFLDEKVTQTTVNVAYTTSSRTYSQCVSNIGTESVQTLLQVQPPKPSEWKAVVRDNQELINPRFVSRCLMLALVCVSFWWTTFSFCKLRMKNVLLVTQASMREKEYGKKSLRTKSLTFTMTSILLFLGLILLRLGAT